MPAANRAAINKVNMFIDRQREKSRLKKMNRMAQFDSNKFLTSSSSLQKFRNNSNSLGRMPSLVNTMDNKNGGEMKIQGVKCF